jgi:hypothetical protein
MFRALLAHHLGVWYAEWETALTTAGHRMGLQTRGRKCIIELLMMSDVPLETCWAFSKLWNNKFYYKLHLVGISTEYKNLITGLDRL